MQLKDELGDLLFQVIFYAQLAAEEQRFDLDDIIDSLVAKLLRRHPHVFPDGTLASDAVTDPLPEAEIKQRWEEIKAEERAEKGAVSSVLDDVPHALPALNRAHKLQKRAASVGFDWFEWMPVRQKLLDELRDMASEWRFFSAYLDMLEMVMAKTDTNTAAWYDQRLVGSDLQPLGAELRTRLRDMIALYKRIRGRDELLVQNPVIKHSIGVRNPYIDPLHLLQAELMRRVRLFGEKGVPNQIDQALMVTMTGIAAGMRNTG